MAAIAGLLLGGLYEHAFMTRSRLQLAADSAAEAGAGAGAAGRDVRQAAEARLALFPQLRAAAVDIEWPPGAGRYRGSNNAVRVTIRGRWKPPLLPVALPLGVSATALAGTLPGTTGPISVRVE